MNYLHKGDLPENLKFPSIVAIDTETMGLKFGRDRLCLVQMADSEGVVYLVQIDKNQSHAPNLAKVMTDEKIVKIFHYARFDIVVLRKYLGVKVNPVFCTKIASKLVRTYTSFHGLKDVTRELLKIDLSKEQQSSDWAAEMLSPEQLTYAANDVLNLNLLYEKLSQMLEREGRMELANSCFNFLSVRGELDLGGWSEIDIFSHK